MDRIDIAIQDACEDQRGALRKFAETGSEDDAASVHFESCPACERALEAIIKSRSEEGSVFVPVAASRRMRLATAVVCLVPCALFAILGCYLVATLLRAPTASATELGRLDDRIVFVMMPGRPDVCVASLRGDGGYGPTYLSAVPCAQVMDRVESDEDLAWHLRHYAVIRMRDTDVCLARIEDGGASFTIPCGSDD